MPADIPSDDDAPEGLGWPDASALDGALEGAEDAPDEGAETPEVPEAPEAEAPAEPEAPEAPEGEQPEVSSVLDKLPPEWQAEVRSARNEAAEARVRSKAYEQAFAEYDDDTRAKFLDLAAGLGDETRHRETAREFVAIGKRILEGYGEDVGDLAAPDPNRPLTAAELDRRLKEQADQRSLDESIRRIAQEVKDLGYEEGTIDHFALIQAANQNPQGDLKQAHEAVQAYKKGIIDSFIAEHSAKAGKHLPSVPNTTGQAPAEAPEELTGDMSDDFAAARRRIDAMLNG